MIKLTKRKKKEIAIQHILTECLNCNKPLDSDDVFCSYCGQKNVEKLSFSNFLGQLISGFFSYDSRFSKTIIPLLFKPGKVSRDYIEGKRKKYVNPFQMYLHVSILFFLILGWTNSSGYKINTNNDKIDSEKMDSIINHGINSLDFESKKKLDSILIENNIDIDSLDKKAVKNFTSNFKLSEIFIDSVYNIDSKKDSIEFITLSEKYGDFYKFGNNNPIINDTEESLKKMGYPINFWNRFHFEQAQKLRRNTEQIRTGDFTNFVNKALAYLSIGLFIFLPIFTLFLNLFYIRKGMNYMEHLVFAFHTQTVFFLLLIISTLISLFASYSNVWIFILLFLIYLFLALKKFYQQGIIKTLVKFLSLNWVYSSLGVIAAMIISVMAFVFS